MQTIDKLNHHNVHISSCFWRVNTLAIKGKLWLHRVESITGEVSPTLPASFQEPNCPVGTQFLDSYKAVGCKTIGKCAPGYRFKLLNTFLVQLQ